MARTGRPRLTPPPKPLELLEDFCIAQWERLSNSLRVPSRRVEWNWKSRAHGTYYPGMEMDVKRAPGASVLRMGPRYPDAV